MNYKDLKPLTLRPAKWSWNFSSGFHIALHKQILPYTSGKGIKIFTCYRKKHSEGSSRTKLIPIQRKTTCLTETRLNCEHYINFMHILSEKKKNALWMLRQKNLYGSIRGHNSRITRLLRRLWPAFVFCSESLVFLPWTFNFKWEC